MTSDRPILSLPSMTVEGYLVMDLTIEGVRNQYRLVLPVDTLWQHKVHPNLCFTREGGKYGVYTIDPDDKMWTLYTGKWFASIEQASEEADCIARAFSSGLHRKKTKTLFTDLYKIEQKPDSADRTRHMRSVQAALKLRGYIDPRGMPT